MKVLAIGVMRMSGIGKESGKQYDFAQLHYLKQIEPTASEKFQLRGYGYEVCKTDLSPDVLGKFAQVPFPCHIDVEVITEPTRNGFRMVVTGLLTVPERKAA